MPKDDDLIFASDDDKLLDDAIPIDQAEGSDDDLLADAIPIDEVTEEAQAGGGAAPEIEPIDLADDDDEGVSKEIVTFDRGKREEDESKYQRKADPDGKGGTRCRSFVAKLRLDAIDHMDEQINAWLDAHPDYTVKCVTSTIGVLKGKEKEDALFLQVFV